MESSIQSSDVAVRIEEFRRSITPDLYSTQDFIDWPTIEGTLDELAPGVQALEAAATQSTRNAALAKALYAEPATLDVVRRLLAIAGPLTFNDGREIATRSFAALLDAENAAVLLDELGLWRIVVPGHVHSLIVQSLVAGDAERRRFRVQQRFEREIDRQVAQAAKLAGESGNRDFKVLSSSAVPPIVRRRADYVVAVDGIPRIAITTLFQATTGGRQQRDLILTYPTLQRELSNAGLSLILIADGKGVQGAPTHALETLFTNVAACLTIKQVRDGALASAFMRHGATPQRSVHETAPFAAIIESTLATGREVRAEDLPGSSERARIELANFALEHPNYAIELAPGGESLRWVRPTAMRRVVALSNEFDASQSIGLLGELLAARAVETLASTAFDAACTLSLRADPVIPESLTVLASSHVFDAKTLPDVVREALRETPSASMAVLITAQSLTPSDVAEVRTMQSGLAVSVVVLDVATLREFVRSAESPRDSFVSLITDQADLTRVSPFVLSSVTPQRMFYGREAELATLVSTLGSNSVAVLGGRRIGKTSLMRQALSRLRDADFRTFFGDCQVVREWADFARLAKRNWGIELPSPFKPHHLIDMVRQLDDGSGRPIVILLDEIDQLLDWDTRHTDDEVPEAFFRACRAVSQEGLAQFVFSGERTIARKMWDSHSPHWNFCRPLLLQQLSETAAADLLFEPLRSMRIEIENDSEFRSELWVRTSGHPQLVQTVGDKLVRLLNRVDSRTEMSLDPAQLVGITESFDFVEHYLETYWGQATSFERLISLVVIKGDGSIEDIERTLGALNLTPDRAATLDALRILDLYGVIERAERGYEIRADWFPTALAFYGGVDQGIAALARQAA